MGVFGATGGGGQVEVDKGGIDRGGAEEGWGIGPWCSTTAGGWITFPT